LVQIITNHFCDTITAVSSIVAWGVAISRLAPL